MNSRDQTVRELLDAYLDDTLPPAQRLEFRHQLTRDKALRGELQWQQTLDDRLRQLFVPPEKLPGEIEALILPGAKPAQRTDRRPRRKVLVAASVAIALSLACVLAWWQWSHVRPVEPFFRPTPLAAIYRETIRRGYRPYYFCDDDDRFASTFAKRQNVPLRLVPLPDGRRMVGLSYAGGLSRNTTAILCYVDEAPVMVFVDRKETDLAIAGQDTAPDLHVYRQTRAGLVMYEVSPLEQAMILDYLRVGPATPGS